MVAKSPWPAETGGLSAKDNVVDRARAGDRTAYGELVRRFAPAIYAVALTQLGNPAEAEEIAQEVFVHSMTRLDQLRDVRCFPGWLRQIAVRMALGRRSQRSPRAEGRAEFLDAVPDAGTGPLEQLIQAEDGSRLRAGLDGLKAQDRAMLEAFYLRSMTLREMSAAFAVPIGTIKRRLHMARNRLRRQLEGCSG